MTGPLPAPPKRFDLVEGFDALALADKKPNVNKNLPDLPRDTFVGGFNPRLLGLNVSPNHRPPPPSTQQPVPMLASQPQPGKQSLTMKYALDALRRKAKATKPALAPPFVTVSPRRQSDSIVPPEVASKPPLSAVTSPTQPRPDAPGRLRSVSVPLSPTTSSGKHTVRCSGMTRAGKQCSRQVKLPATHSHLDPTPVVYCHQHKEAMISAQAGFYVRKASSADRFVEFSHYIPTYLQTDTQLALRVEMEKATSPADVAGYIYTFEIRDPKRPDVIQLKVGRAVNLTKRLDQWDRQCGSKAQIPRGWWPGTVEDGDRAGSLLKGNIKAGDPGPFCHRVERLVHIELSDLSLHAPYLNPSWPNDAGGSGTGSSKRTTVKETMCLDCGVVHREIFAFTRPESGRYKGKEWDLIVKPVIEKWGRFVKEYYS